MDRIDTWIESKRDEMVAMLQELVRIPSIRSEAESDAPFGKDTARCLDRVLEIAAGLGMRTKNFDHYAGEAELGSGDMTMGILMHLDVMPVGENWTKPPFDAVVSDGCIWGRGTSDNKCASVETFFAIRALQECGFSFQKKLRLIFGCDEESNWECMKYYKAHTAMPDFGYVPDGSFPLTNAEKGILHFDIMIPAGGDDDKIVSLTGGERPNVVLAKSTAVIRGSLDEWGDIPNISASVGDGMVTLVSEGIAAHGSSPERGRNAGTQLMKALKAHGFNGNAICFITDNFSDLDGTAMGIAFSDEASGTLSMNLGVLKRDGDHFTATVDIRYPVTMDAELLITTIKARCAAYGAVMEIRDHKAPLYLPKDHPLVTTLLRVYEQCTGIHGEAESTGGGTYARAMPNAVAYGPGRRDMPDHHCHNADEWVSIDEMVDTCKIYAHTILALQDVEL